MAKKVLTRLCLAAAVTAMPFAVLLRVGTWTYQARGWPTWPAVGAGVMGAIVVVTLIGALGLRARSGRFHLSAVLRWVGIPLVVVYAGYGLLYFSSSNAKSERVRQYYTTLHPLLRLSLSTWTVADRDLVVTNGLREVSDYAAMGLPVYGKSRHLVQGDGYVHAVDLRTIGRPAWRNWLAQRYFEILGFRALRHVGTADHLHVSLQSPDP